MKFSPTDEQVHAVNVARKGQNLTIEALAGAGKTSTLKLIAEALPGRGNYVAFNRKIVDDCAGEFEPLGVRAKTAHQLAWASVGKRFAHQPMKQRLQGKDVAEILGVDLPWVYDVDETTVELYPPAVGGLAMQTVEAFGRSADQEIGRRHVPFVRSIDTPGEFHNNRNLAERVYPLARKIWEDMKRPNDGRFVMGFNYLKLWQLSDPVIDGDFLLFDEAQDANPVMLSIVQNQDHMQRIYVGDSRQQIYEWNGAVNALASTEGERCYLTQSFRFGPEIADAANRVLARLAEDSIEVIGSGPAGNVGPIDGLPDALLARTNAGVVLEALQLMNDGYRVFVQGGTWEIVSFAKAAERLQRGLDPDHDDLRGFKTWEQVLDYVEKDALGSDLKLMVSLVDKFSAEGIVQGLSRAVKSDRRGQPVGPVDVVVSTAHKSKGAEWNRVRLVEDFMEPQDGEEIPDPELRLLYVAVTRAKRALDPGLVSLSGRVRVDALRQLLAAAIDQAGNVKGQRSPELSAALAESLEATEDNRLNLGILGPVVSRDLQPRELSIDAARDRLGSRALDAPCSFCGAVEGAPCRIRRGPRAGTVMSRAHTPRVEAASDLHGIPVVQSATA